MTQKSRFTVYGQANGGAGEGRGGTFWGRGGRVGQKARGGCAGVDHHFRFGVMQTEPGFSKKVQWKTRVSQVDNSACAILGCQGLTLKFYKLQVLTKPQLFK